MKGRPSGRSRACPASAPKKIRIVRWPARAKLRLPSFAGANASPRACITPGRRSSFEASKRRLAGETARAATTDEVKQLRREAQDLKEVVAEQALEFGCSKKA